jgi:hypothetical protein
LDWFISFIKGRRRHSALGYLLRAEFERRWWQQHDAGHARGREALVSAAGD